MSHDQPIADEASGALRRVARNTLVLIGLRVGLPAVSLVLLLALSRVLGAEGLGRYSLALTFLFFFNTVTPLGLNAVLTREGAREHAVLSLLLPNAMLLALAAALPMTALMMGLGPVLDYDAATREALVILALAILPYTAASFYEAAFVALQRMELVAAAMGTDYAIKIGGGLAALWFGFGLRGVLVTTVAGRLASWAVSSLLLRRLGVRLAWRIDRDSLRRLALLAPEFLLISVFATLYWRVDMFMLSKLRPIADVGFYAAAYRIFDLAIVIPYSLCLSLYPYMTGLMASDRERLRSLGRITGRYLLAIGLPFALGTTVVAGELMALLYGAQFRAAGATLAVLIWTFLLYGYVRYNAYMLLAANRQRVDLALNAAMLTLNVALNLALIPAYGHLGAAVATLASICAYAIVQYLYLSRALEGLAARLRFDGNVLLASAATGLAAWLVLPIGVLPAIAAGVLAYVLVLYLRGFFSAEELRVLGLGFLGTLVRGGAK